MKKTMKAAGSVLMGGVLAVTAAAFAGCGTKVPDTEDFLEVYCVDLGYGTAWVDAVAEEFFKQDWVQENTPAPQRRRTTIFRRAISRATAVPVSGTRRPTRSI